MLRKYVIMPAVAMSLIGTPALAGLVLVEQDTKTVGETTITWDSSFEDLNYTVGETIEMSVHWTVDEGFGEFSDFDQRGPEFTPKGPDPADGELLGVDPIADTAPASPDQGRVDVAFRFTELHCDRQKDVEIGNAHFSLFLNIDKDGDGRPDSVVGYGVNVHVEEPGRY
jgi:hypothetical protein